MRSMEEENGSSCLYLIHASFGKGCLGEDLARQSLGLVPRLGFKWLRVYFVADLACLEGITSSKGHYRTLGIFSSVHLLRTD